VQREEIKKLMQSADVREGMTAFAERRSPKWTGE
jgi:enoyl-CoA hydratase